MQRHSGLVLTIPTKTTLQDVCQLRQIVFFDFLIPRSFFLIGLHVASCWPERK